MSRSGSSGTMPAGAARRRRRLTSVMRLASTDCVLDHVWLATEVSRIRTVRMLARAMVARDHQIFGDDEHDDVRSKLPVTPRSLSAGGSTSPATARRIDARRVSPNLRNIRVFLVDPFSIPSTHGSVH